MELEYADGIWKEMKYLLVLISLQSGCVSIATHERAKHDEYVKGRINGMNTSLLIMKASETKEDGLRDLKQLLGCSETW